MMTTKRMRRKRRTWKRRIRQQKSRRISFTVIAEADKSCQLEQSV